MQEAVERAIETIWNRYDEPLTLAELADEAILSRFYFSRVFRMVTGTSPGRFLTAVRLFKAKNLLLATPMTVTEISYRVGYNSLGTFTSRFTRCVGMSPTQYRYLSRSGLARLESPLPSSADACGSIVGNLRLPETDTPLRIYVGAFESVVAQGSPISCDVVDTRRPYRLTGVPKGDWFIRAVAVNTRDLDPEPWNRRPLFVSAQHWAQSCGDVQQVDIDMRPMHLIDLPILLALPELDGHERPEQTPVAVLAGR
ncbi:helix-turn-helix transcriptional regulator [Nocardia terpenica]|uniref:Helix-turn-helix domain-containing protein n=1 Tax=Nocardia terpenica TaxID=455432 RepID=A0A161XI12_9NOCA|nr:AraC family transcriptional regulator [Nocardia terpenica]KZM73258.1 hypothetical protein AWN90_31805 [Nocardia terpenica]MBF6064133.1 helix-turn-helix transcriptional regulator [Nocardia terpenica]MBF6106466.1 helix-turn-helix transcriptional regulator [Nocardia terpenica]MBF6113751.1 helix-turn-helix transcriptional regulator [Nocardia terpenica]MBF6120625.1 helix-turn-helix transcriptional regulator [Nocardia terpenica]